MSFFYWLYLWQLKEYRWDRVRAELKSWTFTRLIKRYLLGQWRFPRLTLKLVLISFFANTFLLAFYSGYVFTRPSLESALIALLWLWPLTPFAIAFGVGVLALPSVAVKRVLVFLAARKRRQFSGLVVVGVAGSYGKTTTKEFIAQILSAKFKVLKTSGSVNTEIGIARQILKQLGADIEVYVVEMGAYKQGEIRRICQMVGPSIGVLTGLNEQHLALFGSFENLQLAKLELARGLSGEMVLFYNADDQRVVEAVSALKFPKLRKVAYQKLAEFSLPSRLQVLGFLGTNLAAAIEVAKFLGLSHNQIQASLDRLELPPRTMQISQSRSGATIIDDTYSANPDGFLSALTVLERFSDKAKIVVTSGIIELGECTSEVYEKISTQLFRLADLVIVTNISLQKFFPQASLAQTPREVLSTIQSFHTGQASDLVILLEGRLGAGMTDIVQAL